MPDQEHQTAKSSTIFVSEVPGLALAKLRSPIALQSDLASGTTLILQKSSEYSAFRVQDVEIGRERSPVRSIVLPQLRSHGFRFLAATVLGRKHSDTAWSAIFVVYVEEDHHDVVQAILAQATSSLVLQVRFGLPGLYNEDCRGFEIGKVAKMGTSIGAEDLTLGTGTLGCYLKGDEQKVYAITAGHVPQRAQSGLMSCV